ncbi:MAG: hypothetical protein ACE5O2_13310 [Armatimonadota bacterium]
MAHVHQGSIDPNLRKLLDDPYWMERLRPTPDEIEFLSRQGDPRFRELGARDGWLRKTTYMRLLRRYRRGAG